MNDYNKQPKYLSFLKNLEGKKIRLVLNPNLVYTTEDLIILDDNSIQFTDLKGETIMAAISQVLQVTEVRE